MKSPADKPAERRARVDLDALAERVADIIYERIRDTLTLPSRASPLRERHRTQVPRLRGRRPVYVLGGCPAPDTGRGRPSRNPEGGPPVRFLDEKPCASTAR